MPSPNPHPPAPTRTLIAPERALPDSLRARVARLELQAWPGSRRAASGQTHDPTLAPVSMLLLTGNRVVAALVVLSKPIVHRGERYAASGLSTVVTEASARQRGYGTALVALALAFVAASGADVGLFTCDTPLRAFYERAGWEYLPGTVLVGGTPQAPLRSDSFDKVTLGRFFSERARARRDDFLAAHIDLYPGDVDRLW